MTFTVRCVKHTPAEESHESLFPTCSVILVWDCSMVSHILITRHSGQKEERRWRARRPISFNIIKIRSFLKAVLVNTPEEY